jgi:hypothetical protein
MVFLGDGWPDRAILWSSLPTRVNQKPVAAIFGGTMTMKAHLDNIQAQTEKTPEEFRGLAEKKGLLEEGVKAGWVFKD